MAAAQTERILKELAGLWASMSKGESQGVNSGVLRACAMTLVVAAKDDADAADIGGMLAELMHEHPSRAIVLRPSSEAGVLDARVFAQCWMPFGKRQQICCEQIEISSSDGRVGEIPSVVVGIMVPDLPVVLWARNAAWIANPDFRRIIPLVRKVVVDSVALGPNPFATIRSLQAGGKLVGDLAWTRLTRARQSIANVFEDLSIGSKFAGAASISVEYADDFAGAAYMAGWLKSAAPGAAVSLKSGGAAAVRIGGPALDVEIQLGVALRIRVNGAEHRAMIPATDDIAAMREELSVLCPDPQFDKALAVAEKLPAGA